MEWVAQKYGKCHVANAVSNYRNTALRFQAKITYRRRDSVEVEAEAKDRESRTFYQWKIVTSWGALGVKGFFEIFFSFGMSEILFKVLLIYNMQ